jgi:hypothetical protein
MIWTLITFGGFAFAVGYVARGVLAVAAHRKEAKRYAVLQEQHAEAIRKQEMLAKHVALMPGVAGSYSVLMAAGYGHLIEGGQ